MNRLLKPFFLCCIFAISSLAAASSEDQGTWTPLTNQPNFESNLYPDAPPVFQNPLPGGVSQMFLLTDGSVLVQNNGFADTSEMWRLTPDINGSYINGTWSSVAPLPDNYSPYAGIGAVLPDGRVIIQGGEYNGTNFHFALTNVGYIYDPVADTWTRLPSPPFFRNFYPPRRLFSPQDIGDAACVVLADGTYMVQSKMSGQAALLNINTLEWTETGTSTKFGWADEEGLTLLPNGKVLTVNCYAAQSFMPNLYPPVANQVGSELFDPNTGTWSSAGSTIVSLTNPDSGEIGPAVLRPDGIVAYFGANRSGANAFYDSFKNQWSVGPAFPQIGGFQLTANDTVAALLPNGNVLVSAGEYNDPTLPYGNPPMHYLELTYDTNEFVEQPSPPNAANQSFVYMLVLPTGQVLVSDQTNDVEIYTPGNNNYKKEWAPVVKKSPKTVEAGSTYKIEGIRFNGMSEAVSGLDDNHQATNYPLVRITNEDTGHVFYCRTHDHSSMAVASNEPVSTFFDVPAGIELGKGKLEVVANGIPSKPVSIVVQ